MVIALLFALETYLVVDLSIQSIVQLASSNDKYAPGIEPAATELDQLDPVVVVIHNVMDRYSRSPV